MKIVRFESPAALACAAILAALVPQVRADVLELRNGSTVTGMFA